MDSQEPIEPRYPSNAFVGRERELGELRAGLADVRAGHGRLFLLSGEPGIGKTRLADEFARIAVAQGERVVWGRCWEGDGAPAYWPWIQVVRACLADADAEQRSAILGSEATPQLAQDIAQLVPELHAAHPQTLKHPGPQPSDPEQARFQLFESVATLLKNLARIVPLVIVIDDLHDADQPSLLMQKFIARQTKDARILMIGTYRDAEVRQSRDLRKLVGDLDREGRSILIPGLSEVETGEFVESNVGKRADHKLVADLYHATDGNPLFVDGVLRLLVAAGKVNIARVDANAFKIPDGVRDSIRRRLERLPEETNLMLSIASVIGNDFETRLLGEVSGSAAEQLIERMEEAGRAGIVLGVAAGNLRYRFSHALIRNALYEDLAATRRIELHNRIGSVIEEVHKDDLKPYLAVLAHHFREGLIADKAIEYSILAGDAAEAVFAYEDALSHLLPALALVETHNHDRSQQAGVLLRLGRICCFYKNREQGVVQLETALKIYEQIGDEQHAGEIHYHLGRAFGPLRHQMYMNIPRSLIHYQRAELLLGQTRETHSLGMLYFGLSSTKFQLLQISEAVTASQKAMDIFARLGDRESWALAAGNHSQYLMVKGKLARAAALLDEIAAAATGFVNPYVFGQVIFSCGWFRTGMRDLKEAMGFFRLVLKGPAVMHRALVLEFLVLCELLTGNLAEARSLAAENRVNDLFRSQIAVYQGDWKTAIEMLRQSLDWSRNAGARFEEINALASFCDLLRVTGDYDGAAAAFERVLSMCHPDDLFLEMCVRPQAVLLCFDTGKPGKAAEHLECSRKILAQQEDWLGRAGAVWRAEAIVAAVQDRFQESDHHFEKSIKIFKQYSLPWHEAETLHYWGRALLHAGRLPRAREKLDAAIRMYRGHGAGQCWIDRVEADQRRAQPPRVKQRPQDGLVSAETASGEAVFRNEGDFWTIAYQGRTSRLKDAKGLHYLAYLLWHPGEEVRAMDLAARSGGAEEEVVDSASAEDLARTGALTGDLGHAGEMLDSQAKAAYQSRLTELEDELEEARELGNQERAAKAEDEIEALQRELRRAIGRGGRDRRAASSAERARVAVTRAIRLALNRISEQNGGLGRLLSTTIKTGGVCSYLPDDRFPVSWRL